MEKDDIKYLVLSALGYVEKPDFVQSDDNAVRIVNGQYEHYFSLAVASNKWNFFTSQTELLKQENDGKYRYKYATPDDLEILNKVYVDKYSRSNNSYEMYNGFIYTNAEKCFIEYRKKVCEANLAPYFVEYFRLYMAYNLCQVITGDTNLEQSLFNRYQMAFTQARALDNLQKTPKILNSGIYADVRD
jgi:hypothetical protein